MDRTTSGDYQRRNKTWKKSNLNRVIQVRIEIWNRVVAGAEKDVSGTRWVYSPETGSSRGDFTGMRESIFLSLLGSENLE